MENEILTKVRKLNWVLQEAPKGKFSFGELCEILSNLSDANVYLVNPRGKIIGVHYKIEADSSTIEDPETGIEKLPNEYTEAMMQIVKTEANLRGDEVLKIFKYDYNTQEKYHTFIPIIGGEERLGTLVLARYSPEFSDEDLVLGEFGATVVGLEINRRKALENEEEERNEEIVKMAISTLSYSESEAVQKIFEELKNGEGILVASKIADRSRITRSVIVNALRKLESAGIIESKSLGMKGTHIKVLNRKFYQQLDKLKN
ncbi:MAG TPA: GTP-sensing pleiotropic transcriptional regulator CodY [Bacillota bacterium]|nr:GTP-sensing pleiotropic transcriptional regulator CodY [Bacillota bacterium]HUM55795.1 GTP-sensing pleiotropic transcriptional regulator CodY [Bacillota bacterium]